jgi:hypothetical protein
MSEWKLPSPTCLRARTEACQLSVVDVGLKEGDAPDVAGGEASQSKVRFRLLDESGQRRDWNADVGRPAFALGLKRHRAPERHLAPLPELSSICIGFLQMRFGSRQPTADGCREQSQGLTAKDQSLPPCFLTSAATLLETSFICSFVPWNSGRRRRRREGTVSMRD